MLDLCKLIFGTVIDLLRSRATLEAEIVVLRQQINVLRRANPERFPFRSIDRLILGGVCRLFFKMRTHLSLNKDAPISRAAEKAGRIICRPILGGLHHQYGRI
jgi:hypothetical protein